jgi:signal transduction histidine kinase
MACALPTIESRSKTLLGRPEPISRLLAFARAQKDPKRAARRRAKASPSPERWSPLAGDAAGFASVDPSELAQDVRERIRFRTAARSKPVYVVIQCSCDRVWVKPHAFSQALYELLDNAVRATQVGYPVIVDASNTAEGNVLWQVRDSGTGMSERTLAELGQTSPGVGAGVGVALTWYIVDCHGGLLHFESTQGVGTTASIWLPGRC